MSHHLSNLVLKRCAQGFLLHILFPAETNPHKWYTQTSLSGMAEGALARDNNVHVS